MLQRLFPVGTVLKDLCSEVHNGDMTFMRQIGSYPIVVGVHERLPLERILQRPRHRLPAPQPRRRTRGVTKSRESEGEKSMGQRVWAIAGLASMILLFWIGAGPAAGQDQAPRAARSVHLWYQAPQGVLFYNEVTVDKSQPGTYFCVCGFNHGYFGIQELTSERARRS